MRLVLLVLAASTLLLVPACGGDDEKKNEPSGEAAGSPVETVNVSETEFKLDPANPRISSAGLVEFRVSNDGQTVHALEVEGPSGEAKTADIQPGESASLKVDLSKRGSYEWYCPIGNHRDQGMEGEITVAGGQAGGGSTTGTTETETTETETTETNTTETDSSGSGGSGSGGGGY